MNRQLCSYYFNGCSILKKNFYVFLNQYVNLIKKELQHQNSALCVDANLKYICQELLQNYLNAESASKQPGNAKQNLIDIFDIFLNQIGLTTVEQNGRVIIEVDGIDLTEKYVDSCLEDIFFEAMNQTENIGPGAFVDASVREWVNDSETDGYWRTIDHYCRWTFGTFEQSPPTIRKNMSDQLLTPLPGHSIVLCRERNNTQICVGYIQPISMKWFEMGREIQPKKIIQSNPQMADTDPCIRIEEPVASPAGKHDPEKLLPQIQLRIPSHWYLSSCKVIEVISGVVAVYLQWGEHEVIKSQFSQEAIFRIREQVTFFTNFTKDFTKNTKGEWVIVTDQEMHRELYHTLEALRTL